MLKRRYEKDINEWIEKSTSALLVTGARQIGKTYLIRECLKTKEVDYVEFNFIEPPGIISLFSSSKSAKDLLFRLSLAAGKPLIPYKTVFFL